MARPKGTLNQNLTKTVSIQQQVIAANAKVESTLSQLEKLPEIFAAIKAEVEVTKGDMDLGLKQYESEIQEKRDLLTDNFTAETLEIANKGLELKKQLMDSEASMKKQLEELQYNNKLAIERENMSTAETIANKKGLVLLPSDTLVQYDEMIISLTKKAEADLKIAVNSAVKNAKDEMAKQISDLETANKLINNDLNAANKQVASLEAQISYLKEQVDAARNATVEALAAAKVNITQSNQGK